MVKVIVSRFLNKSILGIEKYRYYVYSENLQHVNNIIIDRSVNKWEGN